MYILLAICCAICFGIGNSMQKHGMAVTFPTISASRFFREMPSIVKTLLSNWVWLLGLGFLIAGFIFQGKSMDAPGSKLSVIMPLLNISTVVTSLIGVFVLREQVKATEWLGIAALTLGAVMISCFDTGSASRVFDTVLLDVSYLAGIASMGALLAGFGMGRSRRRGEVFLAIGSGLGFGMAAVALKMFDLDVKSTIGGFHVSDPRFFLTLLTSPNGWMFIVFNLAGFALFQLSFAHGRIFLIGPLSQVFAMVIPVVAGIAAFHESLVAWQWAGVVVVTASTFFVGSGQAPRVTEAGSEKGKTPS
jgi:drug/metabolite transporter (DMT)-like permease